MASGQALLVRLGERERVEGGGLEGEVPSEVRQLVAREHTLLQRRLHHSCQPQHQTNTLHPLLKLWADSSHCMTHPKYPLTPHSSGGNNTTHAAQRASLGHKPNKAFTFLTHCLSQGEGARESSCRNGSSIFRLLHIKNRNLTYSDIP